MMPDDDLGSLQHRIRQAQGVDAESPEKSEDEAKGHRDAVRAVTDLIATPIVCGGIGIGIDHWFDTNPFFFIALAFLGVVTGFWNLARAAKGDDSAVGFKRLQNKEKDVKKTRLFRDRS